MTRLLSLAACAVTAALLFSPATAEAGKDKKKGGGLDATFKKLDTNGDGKLSKAEFAKLHEVMKKKAGNADAAKKKPAKGGKKLDALFAKLDTNNDGFLSLEEFKKIKELKKKKDK